MYFVYILECNDKSLYTWITNNIEKRLKQHNGILHWWAKYTNWRQPVKLVYKEVYSSKSDALKREIEIKKYSRKNKLNLLK